MFNHLACVQMLPLVPSGYINPLNLNIMRFQYNSRKYLSNCGLIQPLKNFATDPKCRIFTNVTQIKSQQSCANKC